MKALLLNFLAVAILLPTAATAETKSYRAKGFKICELKILSDNGRVRFATSSTKSEFEGFLPEDEGEIILSATKKLKNNQLTAAGEKQIDETLTVTYRKKGDRLEPVAFTYANERKIAPGYALPTAKCDGLIAAGP